MILFIQLIILFVLLYIIILLVYSMVRGGPYAPIGDIKTKNMISLLQVKKGDKAVDIGSGDGRIVRALARAGAEAHGYEVNPLLVLLANYKIRKEKLQGKAFIHLTDFWQHNLKDFDIVTIYLAPHIIPAVEKKLDKELKKGTRVAVNYFKLPNWKPEKQKDTIYLYKKK